MYISKIKLKKINAADLIFFFVAATLFLLPVRTALPLISIGCAFLIFLFAGEIFKLNHVVKEKWFLPALVFTILPWIGLLYSKDLDLGIDYALKTKYWVAMFLTAGFVCNQKRIEILIKVFWLSLFCGSALAFFQYIGLLSTPKSSFLGFGLVYTVLSMYLLIGILTASYFFRIADGWQEKLILIVLLISFLFHLSILSGRNGYFVLILVSPFIAHNLASGLNIILKFLICFILIASLLISPVVQKRIKTTMEQLKRTETIKDGAVDEKLIRPFMYHSALKLFAKNPLFGIGTGSLKYYTEKMGHVVDHPHNNILYMGVSFGIFGIIACLWLFGNMIFTAWKNRESPLGYLIFSIGIVIFLGGFFDTLIINSGTSLLLPMGYGLLNHLDEHGA